MSDLTITIIQSPLYWEDAEQNKKQFEDHFAQIDTPTDLIILPEMFTTGFTMNSCTLFETMEGKSVEWMLNQAKKTNSVIMGSLLIKEARSFYNRLIVAYPDGQINHYDKRHLFRMANEHDYFNSGNKKLQISIHGWKITPLICYDLRFPVWSRNNNATDLYVYVANWPKARISAWNTLLKARAIENLAYVVGVNRIGIDGKDILYNGSSAIIDFKGDPIHSCKDNNLEIVTRKLSKEDLTTFRDKFPAHMDADDFEIVN